MHHIQKASGDYEKYDRNKLLSSLLAAGLSEDRAMEIVREVESSGRISTTRDLHEIVKERLLRRYPVVAARYSLKEAIMKLGPTGFPFEEYIAQVFRSLGYHVETHQFIRGRCVTHEIDLLIDGRKIGECKYHNARGIYTGLKEAMYTYMRFLDIGEIRKLDGVILITNTKFSREAIEFSRCYGLSLLGWKYPRRRGLEAMIESSGVYPITVLSGILRDEEITSLIGSGVISVNQLVMRGRVREEAYQVARELVRFAKKT